MSHVGAFVILSAVVIATPGPDTALTIANTLRGGRRAGRQTAAGVVVGQSAWALAAALGVVAIMRASGDALTLLRLAGAGYLTYLGGVSLLAAWRGGRPAGRHAMRASFGSPFRQGLLSNLANPKMGIFFVSLLPQFVGPSGRGSLAVLALGALFAAMTYCWLSLYAVVVSRFGALLSRPRPRRVLDLVTGSALVALGVRVAAER